MEGSRARESMNVLTTGSGEVALGISLCCVGLVAIIRFKIELALLNQNVIAHGSILRPLHFIGDIRCIVPAFDGLDRK